ncbi:uncharacterized protein PG986_009292 [Apiospora aurea]|uniref:Uncharacterized protein n=1 Tax=Apiospora aurea TaxID=335848 RepID=A0ABR1Q7A5_9PEZI
MPGCTVLFGTRATSDGPRSWWKSSWKPAASTAASTKAPGARPRPAWAAWTASPLSDLAGSLGLLPGELKQDCSRAQKQLNWDVQNIPLDVFSQLDLKQEIRYTVNVEDGHSHDLTYILPLVYCGLNLIIPPSCPKPVEQLLHPIAIKPTNPQQLQFRNLTEVVKGYEMAQARISQEYQATVNPGLALENPGQSQDDAGAAQNMAAAANDQAAPTTTTTSATTPASGPRYWSPTFKARLQESHERMRTDREHRYKMMLMRAKRAKRVQKARLRLLLASKRRVREIERNLRKNRHSYQRRLQHIGWCRLRRIHGAQDGAGDAVEDDATVDEDEGEDEDNGEDEDYMIGPCSN